VKPPPADTVKSLRDRDAWMCGLLADRTLSPVARNVGLRVALFLNIKSGRCDPSYGVIAHAIGVHRTSAIRAIDALVSRGWLAVNRSRGWHRNSFRLIFGPVETVAPELPLTVAVPLPFGDENSSASAHQTVAPVHSNSSSTATLITENEQRKENREGKSLSSTSDAPLNRRAATTTKLKGHALDDAFERFWREYPRKDGKLDARKAFPHALGRATADEIIAGAHRYRIEQEQAGTEKRYLKLPAGWLRGGRWADEPARPNGGGPPVIDEAGNPVEPQPQQARRTGLRPGFARAVYGDRDR
jgi:hypothetical protein